ncbi:MAG: hypothetical protein QNK88_05910, partial [Polaribacter sp.]
MKKQHCLLILILILVARCSEEKECCVQPQFTITLSFTHHWNGLKITQKDFNELKFTNENGERLSIERLRYLISNISL